MIADLLTGAIVALVAVVLVYPPMAAAVRAADARLRPHHEQDGASPRRLPRASRRFAGRTRLRRLFSFPMSEKVLSMRTRSDTLSRRKPAPRAAASRAERRQFRRIGTALSGFLSHDNRWDRCDILDVSANGARVRAAGPVVGRDITLGLERFGLVRAKVVWRKRNLLGLQFAEAPPRVARLMAGFLPKHCLAP